MHFFNCLMTTNLVVTAWKKYYEFLGPETSTYVEQENDSFLMPSSSQHSTRYGKQISRDLMFGLPVFLVAFCLKMLTNLSFFVATMLAFMLILAIAIVIVAPRDLSFKSFKPTPKEFWSFGSLCFYVSLLGILVLGCFVKPAAHLAWRFL
jgi:type III secretory pathway component EscR